MQHLEKLGMFRDPITLALQISEDRWMELQAVMYCVDGHCHKIELPGFTTRSGESFGLTASFHVVERVWHEDGRRLGKISRWVVVNGLYRSIEVAQERVDIICYTGEYTCTR